MENINLSGDLKIIPHKQRVQEIITSIKFRYDPSKSVLVVTPVERDISSLDNPNQKFVVIQKVHLLQAFKELDNEGLFQTLPGHEERHVLCWVVDVCSAALMTYGNIRSNDIDFRFAEKTYPQDLLWVYKTISAKDRPENALKVVERLSKLARIGPNEDIAIRKLCKWNEQNFNNLMLTIDQLEKYETLDVESSVKTSTSQYGKKLKIKHAIFNKLAKIDEDYFSANFEKVVNKKASLKTIVTQFQEVKDIADVYSLLTRISGFQTVESLKLQYPGQFEVDNVKVYVGADFKCKNMKAIMLEKYCRDVLNGRSSKVCISLQEIMSLTDDVIHDTSIEADAVTVFLSKASREVYSNLLNMIVNSDTNVKVGLFVFSSETSCFDEVCYLRSLTRSSVSDFHVIPITFQCNNGVIVNGIMENVKYAVLFGKFVIFQPPLLVQYKSIEAIHQVLDQVVPPNGKIAAIFEPGVEIVLMEERNQSRKSVTYFGSSNAMTKFQKALKSYTQTKEEEVSLPLPKSTVEREQVAVNGGVSNPQSGMQVEEKLTVYAPRLDNCCSSTSPFKYGACSSQFSQDSAIGGSQYDFPDEPTCSKNFQKCGFLSELDDLAADI